jgi:hypothetical protein
MNLPFWTSDFTTEGTEDTEKSFGLYGSFFLCDLCVLCGKSRRARATLGMQICITLHSDGDSAAKEMESEASPL